MNTLLLIATVAVRNPFWPIGYEGVKEVISAEPIVEVAPAPITVDEEIETSATVVEKPVVLKKTITGKHWIAARKSLRIGGKLWVKDPDGSKHQSVMINGLVYANNDLISINFEDRRFTWRVQGLTDGETLKLIRVRAKFLDENENSSETPSKGEAK